MAYTNHHYRSKGKEEKIKLRKFQRNCRDWAERRGKMTRSEEIRSKEVEEEMASPAHWTTVD